MFKVNCILTKIIMIIETVPIVIGALGLVKKGLGKYVEKSLETSMWRKSN